MRKAGGSPLFLFDRLSSLGGSGSRGGGRGGVGAYGPDIILNKNLTGVFYNEGKRPRAS